MSTLAGQLQAASAQLKANPRLQGGLAFIVALLAWWVFMELGDMRQDAIARLDDALRWNVHDAMIHFTTPHGLEQHNGAAWGVRDVCQGSVEWLIAAGEFAIVRRILETVFAQQYPAKPIRMLSAQFGGGSDIAARLLAAA